MTGPALAGTTPARSAVHRGAPPPGARASRPRAPRRSDVTFARVLAAEWTKVAALRSTTWLALGTVVTAGLLAAALGMFARPGDGRSGVSLVVSGYVLAQLGTLVLGVLVGAGEHSTGTATTTFAAVPRRLPVLGAQVLVTAGAALATATTALALTWFATQGQRTAAGVVVDLSVPGTGRALAGFVAYLTGVALLGLGLGALLRKPDAALLTGVLVLVLADQLLAANPGPVTDTVRALLPGAGARLVLDDAGLTALDAASLGPDLGAGGAGLVLGAWVLVLLAAATYRLARHDVR